MQPQTQQPPVQQPLPQPAQNWQFSQEDTANQPLPEEDLSVTWSASEFIAHSKPVGWYMIFWVGAALLAGMVYLVTRDLISVVTVVILAVLFGIVAGRKPRVLQYSIDTKGIHIGIKTYPYSMFKSFSVIKEGQINSLYLTPLKRFMSAVTMYYPPDQENSVVEAMGLYLPKEDRQQDRIDRLMHHIRF